jgi:hypothetical protein
MRLSRHLSPFLRTLSFLGPLRPQGISGRISKNREKWNSPASRFPSYDNFSFCRQGLNQAFSIYFVAQAKKKFPSRPTGL